MVALIHPISGTRYEKLESGEVRVHDDVSEGIFTAEGQWVSGARRVADPQMCRWVADGVPRTAPGRFATRPTS